MISKILFCSKLINLQDAFPVFDCNSTEEKGQYRLSRRSKLFFSTITGVSGIETFLASLDSTILNCPDLVEAGYYHHGNVFAFYSDSATDTKLLQVRMGSKKPLVFSQYSTI